jgi:hypothetical protein
MITIPETVEMIVKSSLFLEEALSQGIVNLSALARQIKPDVERGVMKEVQEGAIIMALKRLSLKIEKKALKLEVFEGVPNIMLRSNLFEITFANSETLISRQKILLDQLKSQRNFFLTVNQGIFETTIIASRELKDQFLEIFQIEREIARFDNLSSITVQLPKDNPLIPGIYSFILKALAWEGISLIEVVSTCNEFTIILMDKDTDSAFSIIKRIFKGPRLNS